MSKTTNTLLPNPIHLSQFEFNCEGQITTHQFSPNSQALRVLFTNVTHILK